MKLYSVKEVMEMSGASRDMLIDYEKRGLLHPVRTGDAANNRRMYREEDIDDLGKVLALRAYEFSLNDIARILGDDEADIHSILQEKLEALRRKENHLRNLILFAKFVDITDTDLITGLLEGPEDIDAFADAIRGTDVYRKAMDRLHGRTDEEAERMFEELSDIVYDLVTLEEEDGFRGVEKQIDAYFAWWDRNVAPLEGLGYLGFWAIFEDDGLLPAIAEAIGEESTSSTLQMSAFYVYMKRLMLNTQDAIKMISTEANVDVIAARERASRLASDILEAMLGDANLSLTEDAKDLCQSILGYMDGIVADEELVSYLDPQNSISIDHSSLAKASSVFELLPIMVSERNRWDNTESECEEISDFNPQGISDAS